MQDGNQLIDGYMFSNDEVQEIEFLDKVQVALKARDKEEVLLLIREYLKANGRSLRK